MTLEEAMAAYREAAREEADARRLREIGQGELACAKADYRDAAEAHQRKSQALVRALRDLGEAVK